MKSSEATFRCKTCNRDMPASQKAAVWEKAPGKKIDLHRCASCAHEFLVWNSKLKRQGEGIVATVQRRKKRGRRGAPV